MKKGNKIVLCTGEDIQFQGVVHGSVGINYALEYDKTAFNEYKVLSYTNPSRAHMCGGDKQDVIYTLTALKEGDFLIKEIEYFRSERTIIKENFVQVKGTRLSSANTYKENVCFDCGNVCSTTCCSKCRSNNIGIVKQNEVYSECTCDKCGYVTHVYTNFKHCPICGTILQRKVVNLYKNKDLYSSAMFRCNTSSNNEPYIIVSQVSEITFWHNTNELSSEVMAAKKLVRRLRIARSKNRPVFGIVDTSGKVLVDFKYDYIQPFKYACLPGPGPLPPIERWFIGAFFTLGNNVGYLRIYADGHVAEYGTCSKEEYDRRCKLS